ILGEFRRPVYDTSRPLLREAIIAANNNPGPDTVTLSALIYTLTITMTGENFAATGDLDIIGELTLAGAGAVIDGGDLDRVFDITSGASAQLSNVTIQNGKGGNGGGIENDSETLTLNNSIVSNNSVLNVMSQPKALPCRPTPAPRPRPPQPPLRQSRTRQPLR
ncbi:MAG: hypothetical protein ACREUU_11385, partial [Gammaproteobacteria bacterium]